MMEYNQRWIEEFIRNRRRKYVCITKTELKRIAKLFSGDKLRKYFIKECEKFNERFPESMRFNLSNKELEDILSIPAVQTSRSSHLSSTQNKPPRKAAPGKVWMKVLRGDNQVMWVERRIDGPDYESSKKSMETLKGDCEVRTVFESFDDSCNAFHQSEFENHMRRYAAGGMTKYQKGGFVKSEWFGKKK